ARCRVVKARHKIEYRALASAGRADKRDRVALWNVDGNAGQRGRIVIIVEMHILEADRTAAHFKRLRIGRRRDGRLYIENGKNACRRCRAVMHQRLRIGEFLQRLIGKQHGGEKTRQITNGEESRLYASSAEINDGSDADARKD